MKYIKIEHSSGKILKIKFVKDLDVTKPMMMEYRVNNDGVTRYVAVRKTFKNKLKAVGYFMDNQESYKLKIKLFNNRDGQHV